jgi:hypothetical protein
MRSTALLALKGLEERYGQSFIRGIRRNGAEMDGRSDGDIRYAAPRTSSGVVYTESDLEDETIRRAMQRAGMAP